VNKPCIIKLEKSILSSSKGKVLSLSNYTAKELSLISYEKSQDVMYMPVDTNLFYPIPAKTMQWKIGFSGRYADPRKNLTLLLNSLQILVRRGFNPQLTLVGERKSSIVEPLIHSMGLTQYVTCLSNLPSIELASILQTLDVFAIPSHQEGLCIAALEAMACGVPIVSTRCGGPEDYVKSGITGELVENNPELFAAAIEEICTNKTKRQRLASGALDWIASNASQDVSRQQFRHHISDLARRRSYVLT
jgi:glycosyltransferase involved in cell wall biosynthesis